MLHSSHHAFALERPRGGQREQARNPWQTDADDDPDSIWAARQRYWSQEEPETETRPQRLTADVGEFGLNRENFINLEFLIRALD